MKKYIVLCLITLMVGSYALAQGKCNFSGLKERTLNRRVSSVQEYLRMMEEQLPGRNASEGGLPEFHKDVVSGKKIRFEYDKGGVESVQTECDAEGKLEGTVYYTGYQTGYLRIQALNAQYQTLAELPALWVAISAGGRVPFTLEIDKAAKEGSFLYSHYLKISYFETKNVTKGKATWFDMIKRWKKAIPNNNKIISAVLSPVGAAASFAQKGLPQPGKQLIFNRPNSTNNGNRTRPVTPSSDTTDTSPKGPNFNDRLSLFTGIYSDIDFSDSRDISSIQLRDIFKDLNPKSTTYYFIPQKYVLNWDRKLAQPFDFRINYGTAKGEDQKVTTNASLSSGITNEDEQFVQALLEKHLTHSDFELKAWIPQNGLKAELSVEGQLGVTKDKMTISQTSDIHEPIKVSWISDQFTSDALLSQLESGNKVTGHVIFQGNNNQQNVPIELSLNDKSTFGRLELDKTKWQMETELWQNPLPFPIKLNYAHALIINKADTYIYSWKIDAESIPPTSKVKFNAASLPSSLNDKVFRLWLDYSVEPCKDCFDEIVSDISNGTAESRAKYIRFQCYYTDFFAKYQVKNMKVTVKSMAADPRGKQSKEITLDVKPEGATGEMSIGPFYSLNNQALNYQYRYTLFTEEKTYDSPWMTNRGLELYLQEESFKQAFKSLKTMDNKR